MDLLDHMGALLLIFVRNHYTIAPIYILTNSTGFPGGPDGEESACNSGDWVQSPGQEEPLEEGVVTQSSILAWRFPWTEEAGGLQSRGSQRVMTEAT